MPARKLTFAALDELAFASVNASARLRDIQPSSLLPTSLGPLIELMFLASEGFLPKSAINWLCSANLADFLAAWSSGRRQWLSRTSHLGFIRTREESSSWYFDSSDFLMRVQRAGREISKLPDSVPGQMASAIGELEGNIQEHSEAASTGVLVFRATDSILEFVVADRGIGLLRSLRNSPKYGELNDHGSALELALTDGVSRVNDPLRGHGFRPIFQGLANLNGYLRFRTGDSAIVMDGTAPTLATAQLSQKPNFNGFFVSVRCEIHRRQV